MGVLDGLRGCMGLRRAGVDSQREGARLARQLLSAVASIRRFGGEFENLTTEALAGRVARLRATYHDQHPLSEAFVAEAFAVAVEFARRLFAFSYSDDQVRRAAPSLLP